MCILNFLIGFLIGSGLSSAVICWLLLREIEKTLREIENLRKLLKVGE